MSEQETSDRASEQETLDEASKHGALDQVIDSFRKRARRLRISAYFALCLIIVAIGGGMYLFVFAGEIASREANLTLDRLSRGVERFSSDFSEIQPSLDALIQDLSVMSQSAENVTRETAQAIKSFDELIRRLVEEPSIFPQSIEPETEAEFLRALSMLEDVLPEVADRAMGLSSETAALMEASTASAVDLGVAAKEGAKFLGALNTDLRDQIASIFGDVLEASAQKSDKLQTTLLVSTLSTRVGAMLLIIFLVQILVNLYRYSIRLASFYEARADAFEIVRANETLDVEKMIHSLSPDNLDFGKSPASPAEHAISLAREVIARQR